MIQHSGVPPIPEHLVEQFGRRACSGMLDLYVGYDKRLIAETSRDYTTFQTPFGALQLVTLPMGWTNSVPIFHNDVTFILQAEIPHITIPYIDNVPIKGLMTMYQKSTTLARLYQRTQAYIGLFGNTLRISTELFRG
jgi:hypothetical protein